MNIMNKRRLAACAITLVLSNYAMASEKADSSRTSDYKSNEIIGLSSGVILGTVIAGPLGGMVAGMFGVMIADDINGDSKLALASAELESQEQEIVAMQREHQQSKQRIQLQLLAMEKAIKQVNPELESNIQFRTASYILEDHYKTQLDLVAKNLHDNPKLQVTVSGFADQRGDSTYNQALSEQRAISVKSYLLSKGASSEQVLTLSHGESTLVSAGISHEDNFFDRRVVLKLDEARTEMTAAKR
jgi:sortase system peptidoglycan-associated protein